MIDMLGEKGSREKFEKLVSTSPKSKLNKTYNLGS